MAPISKISDMTKRWIIESKTAIEAGYVNNPNDRGGETKCGITAVKANEYRADLMRLFKWDGQMRNLTTQMAFYIYDIDFWQKMRLDEVILRHPFIADRLFDLGINAGKGIPVKHLQRALNVLNRQTKLYEDITADGAIGPGTIKALDGFIKARGNEGVLRLTTLLFCLQGNHYVECAESRVQNEEFEYGWAGRVHDQLQFYADLIDAA